MFAKVDYPTNMGQRNMICTSQMMDLEMNQQGQCNFHPGPPGILLGNSYDFAHSNPALSASRIRSGLHLHHLPDHHDSSMFYGTQYSGLPHHHLVGNLDLGDASASNFYNPYMVPSSGSRIFPIPLNHASLDQLPSSSNQGIIGLGLNEYERNNHLMDDVRGSCKRKNAECTPGNYHLFNGLGSSSSSSSTAPLITSLHQWEDQFASAASTLDAAAFMPPEYGNNMRNRSNATSLSEFAVTHIDNHLVLGNYMQQPFQPASSGAWMEQQFGSYGGNEGISAWNYSPTETYLHGRSVNGGSLEIQSRGGQRYQETTNSRFSSVLLQSSFLPHHHHHHPHPHPLPTMQGMQSQNFTYYPHSQLPAPSYGHPTNSSLLYGTFNPSGDGLEAGPRYLRPFPSSNPRINRPQQRGVPQAAPSDNGPRLRILPEDEVAILEFPGFYEVGNMIDRHGDMRLDVDDMSYEELLALEERIGSVNTGLSEEIIIKHLKTRTYVSSADAGVDGETETCIICQVEYVNQEKIGMLNCGHQYHSGCIEKWLLVKNECPICKKPALPVEINNG